MDFLDERWQVVGCRCRRRKIRQVFVKRRSFVCSSASLVEKNRPNVLPARRKRRLKRGSRSKIPHKSAFGQAWSSITRGSNDTDKVDALIASRQPLPVVEPTRGCRKLCVRHRGRDSGLVVLACQTGYHTNCSSTTLKTSLFAKRGGKSRSRSTICEPCKTLTTIPG